MDIIDCHLHFSSIQLFQKTATEISKVDYSRVGLERVFKEARVKLGIGMGLTETKPGYFPDADAINPMTLDLESPPDNLHICLGINPVKIQFNKDKDELAKIERVIREDSKVVGFKVYPGYYPYSLTDSMYQQVFQLAEKYDLPVVIHCGDTFCDKGHLSFSHPLEVNRIAMQHREVRFIMAHFGNPWVIDAAMVIANNPNVYADLSGLTIGSKEEIYLSRTSENLINHIRTGLDYTADYSKLLFGSDWPLVELRPYIDYVKKLIPEKYYKQVFYENALNVFKGLPRN